MKKSYSIIPGLLALGIACTANAWGPHTVEIQNAGAKNITTGFAVVPGEGVTTSDINISLNPSLSEKLTEELASGATKEYKFNFQPTSQSTALNFGLLAEKIDPDHVGEGKTCLFSIVADSVVSDEHAMKQDYKVIVVGTNCSYTVANDKLTLKISEN